MQTVKSGICPLGGNNFDPIVGVPTVSTYGIVLICSLWEIPSTQLLVFNTCGILLKSVGEKLLGRVDLVDFLPISLYLINANNWYINSILRCLKVALLHWIKLHICPLGGNAFDPIVGVLTVNTYGIVQICPLWEIPLTQLCVFQRPNHG